MKDKGKVFSCFACGGGSTMGYKLAGFDVVGCNEVDPKMIEVYKANHSPKYVYTEPIQAFKNRADLPQELFGLDILDGSPPCSSFSIAGNREKDWGKNKVFKEGQAKQVLDTLFFDFIDLAARLRPKIVIAENVKGLLLGNAKRYVREIYRGFDDAGYYCRHWLLDASKMGVPQRRERVFFVALRKDLAKPFLRQMNLFDVLPELKLEFDEPEIPFSEIEDAGDLYTKENTIVSKYWDMVGEGQSFSVAHPKGNFFNNHRCRRNAPLKTITSGTSHGAWHYSVKRRINSKETVLGGSFPADYDFGGVAPKYLVGMSVPPVMMANIAIEIFDQWLYRPACR